MISPPSTLHLSYGKPRALSGLRTSVYYLRLAHGVFMVFFLNDYDTTRPSFHLSIWRYHSGALIFVNL